MENLMKRIALLLILTITQASTAYPMSHVTKAWAKSKGKIGTILYLNSLIGHLFERTKGLVLNEINDPNASLPNAGPEVTDIIHKRLSDAGITDPQAIEIKTGTYPDLHDNVAAFKGSKGKPYKIILLVGGDKLFNEHPLEILAKSHHQAVQDGNASLTKELEQQIDREFWILDHEARHILNKDAVRRGIADFATVAVTALGARYIKLLRIAAGAVPKTSIIRSCLAGVRDGVISNLVYLQYGRHVEYVADKNVQNNLSALQGGIEFMEKTDARHSQESEQALASYPPHAKPIIRRILASRACGIFATHPAPLKRAALFQKRIEALEKEPKE